MSTDFAQAPSHHEDPAYKTALERAEMLQGFFTHLLVYVTVNTGLFFINLFTRGEDGSWWFYWPLLGWGIGLTIHSIVVFGGVFSDAWKLRKADEIYRNRRQSSQHA